MEQYEAEQLIHQAFQVTPQQVVIAKAFIRNDPNTSNPLAMLERFLQHQESRAPRQIVSNRDTDPIAELKKLAECLSWRAAGQEAIWQLVYGGYFVIDGRGWCEDVPNVIWFEGYPDRGNSQSGLRLEAYKITLPDRLRRSAASSTASFLSDPDLYLKDLEISGIHPEIAEALVESVRCFRNELYLASVVLLGKAAEGAWIEAGLSIAQLFSVTKIEADFSNVGISFARKIQILSDWVKSHPKDVEQRCGIRLHDFQAAGFWADLVRDSRNAIHHGGTPATANTHEKVATLMIGTPAPLRTLYAIINTPRTRVGGI